MIIQSTKNASVEEWDNMWQNCNYATFFHSRTWAEIWHVYSKGESSPDAKIILFSDGKKALLPLSSKKKMMGLVKHYSTSPAGTFGGWLSEDQLTIEHGKLLVNFLSETIKTTSWRLNPYDPLLAELDIKIKKEDETHVLDLSVGFDVIHNNWTKGHSSAARKARKAGVTIKEASNKTDWQKYYLIYEDSLRRWGESASSKYEWNLFEIMRNKKSPNIKLWLAEYEGEIIAGALCFYARQHVVYWHGAALEKFFNIRPVNLLMYEVIKNACEEKYKWYDFNPSGGHEGVKRFKKSFGATSYPSSVFG